MRTTTLGELTVSAQGPGCMGMSEFYGHADAVRAVAEATGVAPAQLAALHPLTNQVAGARY